MHQTTQPTLLSGTLIEHLGIFFTIQQTGYMEATMLVTPQHCQPFGKLHGGATLALAESVAGLGSTLLCTATQRCYAIQVSANHLASANLGEKILAKGSVLRQTRQFHIWHVDIFSLHSQQLLSTVNITNAITIVKE